MDLLTHIKASAKPVVLYGMGNGADKIVDVLESNGISPQGVFASDGFVRAKRFRGMPLMSYAEAKAAFGDMLVLMSFGSSLPQVLENVKRIASEQELFVPDVPVVGEGFFDSGYAAAHRKELETVYAALATEKDRRVYESLVRYKLSGEINRLYESAGTEEELFSMLSIGDNESYMDCGAFNGDTVRAFLGHCGGYRRIIAVEPDGRSYRKLCDSVGGLERVVCINAPLGANEQTVRFNAVGSRGSKLDDCGVTTVQKSIDGILGDEGASYIKLDVEGAESEVIKGAERTIKAHRPKLLVSCYHRVEDIFALPLQVLSMVPDYKLHIWHPMYLPPWDAAYIFV